MLDPRQACYRRVYFTETALAAVAEDIRYAIEESKVTILILFNFSKAFDSIPDRRLLQKPRSSYLSNSTITWFYKYISDRYQAVINEDGTITSWVKSSSGVPQGSILSPLLFALYINDLPSVLRNVSYMIHAGDTQFYGHFKPSEIIEGIARIMQRNA